MSELPPQPGFETVHQYEPGPPNQPPPKKGMSPWIIVLLVLGGMCVIGIPILAALLFPLFAQAKVAANRAKTISNMKQANLCILFYTADHDDLQPSAHSWQSAAAGYTDSPDIFGTSGYEPKPNTQYLFAFAEPHSLMSTTSVASMATTIMLFESTSTKQNTHGGPELLPDRGYHGGKVVISRVDGSAKPLDSAQLNQAKTVGDWDHFPVKEKDAEGNWVIR